MDRDEPRSFTGTVSVVLNVTDHPEEAGMARRRCRDSSSGFLAAAATASSSLVEADANESSRTKTAEAKEAAAETEFLLLLRDMARTD